MKKFAIDLTWVRHGIVGGTESFICNLLRGMMNLNYSYTSVVLVAHDNKEYFKFIEKDKRFVLYECDIKCSNVRKRIVWQNFQMSRLIKRLGIDICFEPVYAKPFILNCGIKYVTVIHDLHALYLPEQHSKFENIWLRFAWLNTVKTSYRLVGITDYVVNDITKRYHLTTNNIKRIYNPIYIANKIVDFKVVAEKYELKNNEYYYTVAKLNRHKNLLTLINVIAELDKRGMLGEKKLVITGPNGEMQNEIIELAKKYKISDKIILTGYVSEEILNCLYNNCSIFLYPSIFEGFGMPLVEAMKYNKKIICTTKTCMPEVTQGLAYYVENPFSVEEWIMKICKAQDDKKTLTYTLNEFEPHYIAEQYIRWILE